MDVRYDGSGRERDLTLVNRSTSTGTTLGHLCTLFKWHNTAPVDSGEKAANDLIEQIQGNRNAFIDDPTLVLQLYGPECGENDGSDKILVTSPTTSDHQSLRIATWNIANFWHMPNEHLRPQRNGNDGLQRTESDYNDIKSIISELDADVWGLQEIGSPEAAESLFPNSDRLGSSRFHIDSN